MQKKKKNKDRIIFFKNLNSTINNVNYQLHIQFFFKENNQKL
jgi:hypothetical protein